MKTIKVRVPDEMFELFKKRCSMKDISMNKWLYNSIDRAIRKDKKEIESKKVSRSNPWQEMMMTSNNGHKIK